MTGITVEALLADYREAKQRVARARGNLIYHNGQYEKAKGARDQASRILTQATELEEEAQAALESALDDEVVE